MQRKVRFPSGMATLAVAVVIWLAVYLTSEFEVMGPDLYQVIEIGVLTAVSALGMNLIYGFNGQFSLGHIGFYAIGAYSSALITKDFLSSWSGDKATALSWIIAGQVGVIVALFVINLMRVGALRRRLSALLGGMLRPYEAWILVTLVVLIVAAVGLAVGAAAAWGLQKALWVALHALMTALPTVIAEPLVFLLALLNGGTLAALVAYLVGLPLLRLSSDYFGIATLGFSIMVYTALQNSDQVIPTMKGARGMVGIPNWTTWTWAIGVLAVVVIIMRNLIHSSHGRAIVAVREDEIAAKTMGIDVTQAKALAFTFGAFFAGVAGGLYAHLFGFLHPSTFNFIKGFDPLIIIVFGGLGSMTGTIVASAGFALLLYYFLPRYLPTEFVDWRFVLYAIALLLVMLLRKQGLLGTSEWGWLRAPLPPVRDIPIPDRTIAESPQAASGEGSMYDR